MPALILCFVLLTLSPVRAAPPAIDAPLSVSVVVEGSLPGFTTEQLSAYVSQRMAEARAGAWTFAPAADGADTAPNRVVWRFKLLPYAGGAVRYIGPAVSRVKELFGVHRAVGIDAKIYLNGQYQSATFDQATISGGPNDPDLSRVIERVTKAVVADALSENRPVGTRPAVKT